MTGSVLTVAQQKGGAGKTTIVAHLAVAFAEKGLAVAVVDIDPQASLAAWLEARETAVAPVPLTGRSMTGWRAGAEVARLARDHDIVLLDSPPHAETEARIAIRAADFVLIPVQPSPMDAWATRPTIKLAEAERKPMVAVLNRVPSRSVLTLGVERSLRDMGIDVAEARIGNRTLFARAMMVGRTAIEVSSHSIAAEEVRALAAEIAAKLGLFR